LQQLLTIRDKPGHFLAKHTPDNSGEGSAGSAVSGNAANEKKAR
jgi:hypothetical protein